MTISISTALLFFAFNPPPPEGPAESADTETGATMNDPGVRDTRSPLRRHNNVPVRQVAFDEVQPTLT